MTSLESYIKQAAKKHKDFDQKIRFNHPRKCKVSMMDNPAERKFSTRTWLRSKVGESSEYSLAPLKNVSSYTQNTSNDFYVTELDSWAVGPPDYLTYGVFTEELDIPKMLEILKSGKAVLGTISVAGVGDEETAHQLSYVLRPVFQHAPYESHLPQFFLIETYEMPDGVRQAFEFFFRYEFDPEHTYPPVQVVEMNQIELQGEDELCVSWGLQILYYLAKVPIRHMEYKAGGVFVEVNKPLNLTQVIPSSINRMLQKLKNDVIEGDELLPKDAKATVFPHMFGSAKPRMETQLGDVVEVSPRNVFEHSTSLPFKKFFEKYKDSSFIFTYPLDSGEEHSGSKKIYLRPKKDLQLFNMNTHSGAMKFIEKVASFTNSVDALKLLELYGSKLTNAEEFYAGADPKYRSKVSNDRELVSILSRHKDEHRMDGWVLKLSQKNTSEYLFLYPNENLTVGKKEDIVR